MSVTKMPQLDPGVLLGGWAAAGVCVFFGSGAWGGIGEWRGGYRGFWKGKKLCGAKKQPDPQVRLGLSKYAQQAQTIFKVEQYKNQNFSLHKLFQYKFPFPISKELHCIQSIDC